MSIKFVKTGAAIGAEIRGIDLSQPLDDDTFAEIEGIFNEHGVIILRDQKITPEQQVAFSSRFGDCAINHNAADFGIKGNPEIYIISNIVENGRFIGTPKAGPEWHTDMSYAKIPARATMLHAIEVPEIIVGEQKGPAGVADLVFRGGSWSFSPRDPETPHTAALFSGLCFAGICTSALEPS